MQGLPLINLSLAQKDENFIKIHHLIEAKRNMLFEKQYKLKYITKNNEFLDDVRKDYIRYNNYILKQKQEQIQALNLLNKYIKDLRKSGQLSKNNIKDAKHEQIKILYELDIIKKNLDELVNETI